MSDTQGSHHNRTSGRGTSPVEKIDALVLELRYPRNRLKISESETRSALTSAVFNFESVSKLAEQARVLQRILRGIACTVTQAEIGQGCAHI